MPGEPPPQVVELESFLAERGERLLRTAILLTGSREAGEDLLQTALERLIRNWRAIRGNPEAYLRRTITHLATDRWRRNGRWLIRIGMLRTPGAGEQPDETSHVDQRDQLVRLLAQLPSRQRTAIVLRYWEELNEAETAEVMGCAVGTVKSATSRGLQRLRELSGIDSAGQQATTGGQQR
jgi:RNA polymerase sigma-70 factor (sigma-E family)